MLKKSIKAILALSILALPLSANEEEWLLNSHKETWQEKAGLAPKPPSP